MLVILRFILCGPSYAIKRRAVAPIPDAREARMVIDGDEMSTYSYDDDDFIIALAALDEGIPPPMIALADRNPPLQAVVVRTA